MKQCISILEEKKTQATYFRNILEENKSEIQTNKDTNTLMKQFISILEEKKTQNILEENKSATTKTQIRK